MTMRQRVLATLLPLTVASCTSLLGDFTTGGGDAAADASADVTAAGEDADDAASDSTEEGSTDATSDAANSIDAPVDAPADVANDVASDASTCSGGEIACNGTCVLPSTAQNCGGCNITCPASAPVCAPVDGGSAYACVTGCAANETRCGSTCVNTGTDPNNCGACSNVCSSPTNGQATCSGMPAMCGFTCNSGYSSCAMGCVDFSSDNNNCGGCGAQYACPALTQCTNGTCQCTGAVCSGACVDLQNDPNNCGACGHGCLGGTCSGGMCQPVLLASLPNTQQFGGIAVDSASVYFTDGNGAHLYKCPLSGCGGALPSPIWSATSYAPWVYYDGPTNTLFAVNGGANGVWSLTANGTVNWGGYTGGSPNAITGDSSYVYWGGIGVIGKSPKTSLSYTQLTTLSSSDSVVDVVFDPGTNSIFGVSRNIGATGQDMIVKCPTAGGACTTLNTPPGPYQVAIVGQQAFFVVTGTSSTKYVDGGLYVASTTNLAGGYTAMAIGTQYSQATAVTADAKNIYFASTASKTIYKCAVGGCQGTPTGVANGQWVSDMVNDANAVYWSGIDTYNSNVWGVLKVAK